MTPIRKGSNPVKIPFQIKSSDRTFASWANEVRTALLQLEGRVPTANVGRAVSSGTQLQFKIYGVRYDTEAEKWFCKVRPGWVRSRNPDSEAIDPIKDWMPTAGDPAVALDAEEPPEIEIADGQTVYCRVTTSPKGIIEEEPTIEAAATPQAGEHFQPPDVPTAGDLYFPLCNITIEGDPEVVTLEQVQQGGPIDVVPNLPELKNVGDEREVFKGRESAGDTYDFRTLKQIEPDAYGFAIIKPEPENETEANELETIDFKFITQREEDAQVQVEDVGDGEGIRIKGNGNDLDYLDPFGGQINFVDGLVTNVTPSDVEGANFNIKLLNVSIVETSGETYVSSIGWGSGGTEERRFYVRGGLITLIDDAAAVDEYEVISRIEGEDFSVNPDNQSGDGFTEADP
jgi:hypothetical protein